MIRQIKELDCALRDCIQRFRDETTGTKVRVLIAEFEELMVLRTELLTQMVIAEQRVEHICKRYRYDVSDMTDSEGMEIFVPCSEDYSEKCASEQGEITYPKDSKINRDKRNLILPIVALAISVVALMLAIIA